MMLPDRFQRDAPKTRPTSPVDSSNSPDLKRTEQLVSVESAMNLEAHFQQPIEDSKVMKDLITLRSYIASHTTTHYHENDVVVDRAELEKHIEDMTPKNTTDTTALTNILLESRSRQAGIRIIIARTLFASIDFFGDPRKTLLSPAAVSLMSEFRLKGVSQESETNASPQPKLKLQLM